MKNNFELVHVGINTPNADEALKLAELLSMMFNLEPRHGQKSEFGGSYFEGFSFNMDTAAYTEAGKLKNIYLNGEYGGFAIHILQK